MQPIGKHILIEWDNPVGERKILTLTEDPRPNTGVVKGVGSKVDEVTEGDRILFRDTFSTQKIPDMPDYLVMHEDNILLVL